MKYFGLNCDLKLNEIKMILEKFFLIEKISEVKNELLKKEGCNIEDFINSTFDLCKDFFPSKDFFGRNNQSGKYSFDSVSGIDLEEIKADLSNHLIFSLWVKLKADKEAKIKRINSKKLFNNHYKYAYKDKICNNRDAIRAKIKLVNNLAKEDIKYEIDEAQKLFINNNYANFSNNLKDYVHNHTLGYLCHIKQGEKEYKIHTFEEKLTFTIIKNARINPYQYKSNINKHTKYRNFTNKIVNDLSNITQNNEMSNIHNYFIERSFHIQLIKKISMALSKYKITLGKDTLFTVAKCFSQLCLLPNIEGRLKYVDLMLQCKDFSSLDMNDSDLNDLYNVGIIAKVSDGPANNNQRINLWLSLCERYILHMYTYCIPVLENCFYYLINSYLEQSKNPNLLYELISDGKVTDKIYSNNYYSDIIDKKASSTEDDVFSFVADNVCSLYSNEENIKRIINYSTLMPSLIDNEKTKIKNHIRNLKIHVANEGIKKYK